MNPWTNAPTTMSNQYFVELLDTKWTPKKWDGPLQYEDPSVCPACLDCVRRVLRLSPICQLACTIVASLCLHMTRQSRTTCAQHLHHAAGCGCRRC